MSICRAALVLSSAKTFSKSDSTANGKGEAHSSYSTAASCPKVKRVPFAANSFAQACLPSARVKTTSLVNATYPNFTAVGLITK